MNFAEIEQLAGQLPRSARERKTWWTNTAEAQAKPRPQQSAGWRVQTVDQESGAWSLPETRQ
jgi:hypothetical protein